MNEKALKTKNTDSKKKAMGIILEIRKESGQQCLFHLWQDGWIYASGTFHSPFSGWFESLFPRGQRSLSMQLLQSNDARKYLRVWKTSGRGKSKRVDVIKKANGKMVIRGLTIKNRKIYKIK